MELVLFELFEFVREHIFKTLKYQHFRLTFKPGLTFKLGMRIKPGLTFKLGMRFKPGWRSNLGWRSNPGWNGMKYRAPHLRRICGGNSGWVSNFVYFRLLVLSSTCVFVYLCFRLLVLSSTCAFVCLCFRLLVFSSACVFVCLCFRLLVLSSTFVYFGKKYNEMGIANELNSKTIIGWPVTHAAFLFPPFLSSAAVFSSLISLTSLTSLAVIARAANSGWASYFRLLVISSTGPFVYSGSCLMFNVQCLKFNVKRLSIKF